MSADSFRADGFISEMAAADPYKSYVETEKCCHAGGLKADLHSVPSSSVICFVQVEKG